MQSVRAWVRMCVCVCAGLYNVYYINEVSIRRPNAMSRRNVLAILVLCALIKQVGTMFDNPPCVIG